MLGAAGNLSGALDRDVAQDAVERILDRNGRADLRHAR
jgi:hypothetical protein